MIKRKGLVQLATSEATVSLFVVMLGFLFGTILLLLVGKNPGNMYKALYQVISGVDITRGVWNPRYIGEWIVISMPLICGGLSMAFAARAGLFNIGAEGQYIIGLTVAQSVAFIMPGIPFVDMVLVVVAAIGAAALWGVIVGYLKARFAVSEVVSTIMMNYIAYYVSRIIIQALPGANTYRTPNFPETVLLKNSWLESITNSSRLNTGIFLVLFATVFFWILIEKTKTGFALRATGFNKEAARCSGINIMKSSVLSMAIAGAFAGLGGAIVSLGSFTYGRVLSGFDNYGFLGIAVALVGNISALGVFLSGLVFGMLQSAQPLMQSRQIPKEITNIISGIIVVLISLRSAVYMILSAYEKAKVRKKGAV